MQPRLNLLGGARDHSLSHGIMRVAAQGMWEVSVASYGSHLGVCQARPTTQREGSKLKADRVPRWSQSHRHSQPRALCLFHSELTRGGASPHGNLADESNLWTTG